MAHTYSHNVYVVEDNSSNRFAITLTVLGRTLLALMFILSGLGKFGDIPGTAAFVASAGLPAPILLASCVALFEIAAGLALAAGWQARVAACALGLFTIVATLTFHAFWSVPPAQQFVQQLMFMKNLSIVGAMFFITAMGGGRGSIDSLSDRS